MLYPIFPTKKEYLAKKAAIEKQRQADLEKSLEQAASEAGKIEVSSSQPEAVAKPDATPSPVS